MLAVAYCINDGPWWKLWIIMDQTSSAQTVSLRDSKVVTRPTMINNYLRDAWQTRLWTDTRRDLVHQWFGEELTPVGMVGIMGTKSHSPFAEPVRRQPFFCQSSARVVNRKVSFFWCEPPIHGVTFGSYMNDGEPLIVRIKSTTSQPMVSAPPAANQQGRSTVVVVGRAKHFDGMIIDHSSTMNHTWTMSKPLWTNI